MKVTYLIGHMVKERDLILYELACRLGECGADVTIISGYPSRRLTPEVIEYYHNHPVEKYSDNVTSIRVGSKKGEGGNLFTRMLKYLTLSKEIYKKAAETETDVYYIYSTPPFLGYYAKKLSKIAPVVYNAQDLFPDSLKVAMHLGEKNPLIKFLRKKEKEVYDGADKIITISQDMKKTICENGGDESKISVIENWADTELVVPVKSEDNRLYDEFKIKKDVFTVLYAGDIGIHQHLDIFLETAKCLKGENIQFVFFGNGAYAEPLKAEIKKSGLDNFSVFPLQPINRISEVYSLGDIDIISLEKGMTRLAVPSKLWSIMSAGRPVLAQVDKGSEMAAFIDGNIGYAVSDLSPGEMAKLLLECAGRKEELAALGRAARESVCTNNNKQTQTQRYYDELIKAFEDRKGGN